MVTNKKSITTFRDGDAFVICLRGYESVEEKALLNAFLDAVKAQVLADGNAEPVKAEDRAEEIAEKAAKAAKEETIAPAPLVKEEVEKKEAPAKEESVPAKEEASDKKAEETVKEEKAPEPAAEEDLFEKERRQFLDTMIEEGEFKGKTFKVALVEINRSKKDSALKGLYEIPVDSSLRNGKNKVFVDYIHHRFKTFKMEKVSSMSMNACKTFINTYSFLCSSNRLSRIAQEEGFKDFDELLSKADEEQYRTAVSVLAGILGGKNPGKDAKK